MYKSSYTQIISTACLIFAASIPAQAVVSAYWRFEEGTNGAVASGVNSIIDSSGNGNHGTPSGNPTYSSATPGSALFTNNLSLDFDGSGDIVTVANSASLSNTSAFTIEFWMRSGGTGAGQDLLVDKSHGFTDSTGWLFQSQPNTGIIFFAVGIGGGGSTNFQGVLSQNDLFDNAWHHLAGTYDGDTVEFFVDGVSQGTNNVGTYVGNNREVRLGNTSQLSRFYDGQLDELRISDTVLTPSEFLTAVPEPSTYAVIIGVIAFAFVGMRRFRK